jgi:hypothetical protein
MAVDPRQLAERLGLEFRVKEGPNESDAWPVVDVTVSFFEEGDPAFSLVARDGALIPCGVPVESFREDLAKAGGVFRLPDGTPHPVSTSRMAKASSRRALLLCARRALAPRCPPLFARLSD